jgi:RimJ/RimL family protein N-acetyltransferase
MGCGTWSPVGRSVIGELNENGSPRWAAVYDHYEPAGSIQLHIAIDNPKYVTRQAIQRVFEYPFNELGVKKVLGIVNSTNEAALTFDMRLGFTVEAVISDAYDMGSMYILSMTREQCRWLRGQDNGIKCESSAAA